MNRCKRCNGSFEVEIHHIQPRATGGDEKQDNLIPLCRVCHNEIHVGVTNWNPAKITGDEFDEWLNENVPEQRWDTNFICEDCGYRWIGKPIQDRPWYRILCARSDCEGVACFDIGKVLVDAYSLRKFIHYDRIINYTCAEFDRARTLEDNHWILDIMSQFSKLSVYNKTRELIIDGDKSLRGFQGRPPLGFKNEKGRTIRSTNYEKVREILKKTQKGEITKTKAARDLETSRASIRRALEERPELFNL